MPTRPPSAFEPDLAFPAMDHTPGGAKSCQFSHDLAQAVLDALDAGWPLARILALPDMPSRRTLYDWRLRHPAFEMAWMQIRARQARERRRAFTAREDARRVLQASGLLGAKPGRKSTYTPARGDAFCELLLQGLTLREIAARPGMPAVAMVYRWLRNHPEFRTAYAVALELREELAADQAIAGGYPGRWTGGRPGQLRPHVWLQAD
ncbi:hypothetical protein [Phenylobacterium sp.]|jgi:hypothetical protein|uniref:terminase small subunit-like protein n=1 Tax=Phenylobacterium sp. TaxID=1871053 RepID=UPI002F94BA74